MSRLQRKSCLMRYSTPGTRLAPLPNKRVSCTAAPPRALVAVLLLVHSPHLTPELDLHVWTYLFYSITSAGRGDFSWARFAVEDRRLVR